MEIDVKRVRQTRASIYLVYTSKISCEIEDLVENLIFGKAASDTSIRAYDRFYIAS